MAKYYKDTSPLAMGRKQKGSAAYKKKKKDDEKKAVASKPQSSVSQKERINQKSYGTTKPRTTQRASSTSSTQRSQATERNNNLKQERIQQNRPSRAATSAQMMEQRRKQDKEDRQAQKSGIMTESLKQKQEENKARMQKTAAGRIISNAPERWANTQKRIMSETGVALADIGEMGNQGKTNPKSRYAQEMGDLLPDRKETREKSARMRDKLIDTRDKLEEKGEKLKGNAKGFEKTYYGAEESGQGMLSDFIMSRATGGRWEIPLALRSYGAKRGKAEEMGATTEEDRLNAVKDAITEVATEKIGGMFGAVGKLTGGKKAAKPLVDRIEGQLARRLEGKAIRDAAGAGLRWGADVLGENIEEWIANPVENLGENLIYKNRIQAERQADIDNYFSDISTSIQDRFRNDPGSLDVYVANLNSKETREDFVNEFKSSGMTDKQAERVADKMIDFMAAAAENDTARMKKIQNSLDDDLVGDVRNKVWDWNDQLETTLATTLLTGATGLPGAVSTTVQGQAIKDSANSRQRMMNALRKVAALDSENSTKSQAMLDSMEKDNYEPTATQAYDIMRDESRVMAQAKERQASADAIKARGMAKEDLLVPPAVYHGDGTYSIAGEATAQRYEQDYNDTMEFVRAINASTYQGETDTLNDEVTATAVASFNAGTLTVAEISELTTDNPEQRYVFKEMTGVDLDQYNVYKNGKLDKVASNIKMQEGLLARSAQNYIESARIEQENWNDTARGEMAEALSPKVGGRGDEAIQIALDNVDPRDRNKFILTGQAANRVYEYARNTNDSWEDVKSVFREQFKNVDEASMQAVFGAAKADKAAAEEKYYGKKVDRNSLTDEIAEVPGKFTNESERVLKNSEMSVLSSVANALGINVIMTDSLEADENGRYMPKDRTILLNAENTMDENLQAIFSHEVTHHLAIYATDEYMKLSRFVMDRWYKGDPEAYNKEIGRIQKLYKDRRGQDLTPEEALEELIADGTRDFWSDEAFIDAVTSEEPTLAQSIINAIKDFLNKLRSILATGNITDEDARDGFFAEIDAYDNAYRLWLNAYNAARKEQADRAIDEWQNAVNGNVASEATNNLDDDNIMSSKDIEATLKENFDEYKTDEENLGIATEALGDLQNSRLSISERNVQSRAARRSEQVRTIAKGITSDLVHEGYIEFRGREVKGPEDLAKLCQVLRDPRFETVRIVLTKKDKIVSFTSVTSSLPGISRAFKEESDSDAWDNLKDRIARSGADGFYIVHNHPSGNVTASRPDLVLTAAAINTLGSNMYKGHIILDHDKYGLIENIPSTYAPTGETLPTPKEVEMIGQQTIDFIHEPEIDHPLLGEKVADSSEIAKVGHDVSTSNNYSVLLYLDAKLKVRGVQEVLNKTLKNDKGIEGFIRNQAVEFGSMIAALYTTDTEVFDKSLDLIRKQIFIDSVYAKPASAAGVEEYNARFSLNEPVERVRDLIAVHNLKPDDIRNTLKLGGFPMPSIAVVKDNMGHDMYGDITLMFHSDTIDPKVYRANQVFGGDAYTPTFPAIRYKPNDEIRSKISDLYYDNADSVGYEGMRGLYRYAEGIEDELNSAGGEAALIDRAKHDTALMHTFLKMNNEDVENVYKRTETKLSEYEIERNNHFIGALGEEKIREYEGDGIPHGQEMIAHRKQWLQDNLDDVKTAYSDYLKKYFEFTDEDAEAELNQTKMLKYSTFVRDALNYLNNGDTTVREELDTKATNEAIEKAANESGFDNWIEELFSGIEEKQGIRNNKDYFTNMGNRRKWETLHDPVTLENVVRVMKSNLDAGANGLLGANPKGASQKKYRSLDEIRADEDRLQMLPEEEYTKLESEAMDKFVSVCSSIYDHNASKFSNSFGGTMDVGEAIAEILNETRTKAGIQRTLTQEYQWRVTDSEMDDLMEAIDAIANVPTGYFEAKPKRAVGFNEVRAAVIPATTDDDIKSGLSERNIPIYEYNPETEGDRIAKVNEAASEQNIRFSITDSEGTELSEGQVNFFENSKNRDAEGHLKVMLHGTNAEFTEFDPSKAQPGTLGRAFYFSDSASHAGHYGNVGRYYLNIEHPLVGDTHDITKDQLRSFITKLAEDEDYGIENYGASATIDSVTDSIWGSTDFVMLRDLNLSCVGDFAEALKVFNRINGTEYDGIITAIETVAFYPQQIKRTDNLNPTLNKDTRYSITDSHGKVLSDGQVDYFKNSQARDEQGRLVPVYHGTFRGPRITAFDAPIDGIWFTSDKSIAEDYSMGYEMGIPGAKIGTERNPYDSDDEYFAKKGIRFEEDTDGNWSALIEKGGRELHWGAAESKEDLIDKLYERNEDEDLFDSQFSLRDYYPAYLNLENPRIINCNGSMHDDINGTGMTTRDLAAEAIADGYDGIIFLNVVDPFEAHDVYVAFSSNQIKDIRNENPTENPDIRYSFVDDEEVKSQIAYEDAMDDSYEALVRYEKLIDEVEPETYHIKPFKEEDVAKFWSALKSSETVPSDDPYAEEDRVRIAKSKEEFWNSVNAKWQDRWTTGGEVLDVKSVRKDIRELVKGIMANSDTDAQYRNDIVRKTLMDVRTAYQLMKQDETGLASYLLYHSAQRMIDNVEFYEDTSFKMYKEFRDYIRRTRISLGEEYWSDVDYNAFRKRNFGRLKLVKGNTNVDDVYKQLQRDYPEWFNEEEQSDPPEQLLQIEHVLDTVQPYKEAYSSEEAASLATSIADELYEIMAGGREVRSLADQYKERYDRQTKAMKQRHAEAILRMRKARDEGIKAEREKWRARESKRKNKTYHDKYFNSIKKSYDKLVERLRTNTKDKHIPEQYKRDLAGLLAAFDFQTVASKKREAATYHRSKKSIKMSAIRTALRQIENQSKLFHINDSITEIIDDLLGMNDEHPMAASVEGKTLDELSVPELERIDKLMKALVHEFNTYETVRIGAKRQQAADIGHAQNDTSLEHAKAFGEGKDYQNFPGKIDKLINLDEMTAAYLFRRVDPDGTGIGLMWKQVRRSFDRYVRNQNELNGWIEDIIGKYHSKGILWNKYGSGELADWRSENYARTFELTNGTVTLTPAQIMSLSCLANRRQAKGHMLADGIVVAPVSFNAKILSDVKKKVKANLPVRLTDEDIKKIVATLTPEQRQVAEKLQELMATKMADWGNEASMAVIGIELFKEPDYFPIKSDKAALTKDLSEDQFVQAIRNFGFTKAVQPNASNAIMVEDIFDVVAEHCNNMNLYNSYSEAFNDFMKVYNYKEDREDGTYSVEQALAYAYSKKATTFIMSLMKDLNGNVSGRASGINSFLNSALGNAKKASVFANLRVAAQQPTALTRAFAEIDPKYLKSIKIERGAMDEMFEHCPIALWKSWGYYDINMGKSIEDLMMNNGRWLEDKATDIYGALDNVTWTALWQMVKAEVKDKHPKVKAGTDEFWDLCNERMSEIVDLTQVVDSPIHRSHVMRAKDPYHKMITSFMAEPTLTFNMFKDGIVRAKEAWVRGDKGKATKIMSRTLSVFLLQAGTVATAAALVDALRKKNPGGDDDDDERFLHLWWINTIENFKDNVKIWNNIYVVKDIASLFDGRGFNNLALQGWKQIADGWRQLQGDSYVRSSNTWYENMLYGIGYMTGVPVKTMKTGLSNVMDWFGIKIPGLDSMTDNLDNLAKEPEKKESKKSSLVSVDTKSRWFDYENNPINIEDGSFADNLLNHFGINLTAAEKAAISTEQAQKARDNEAEKIRSKTESLTGEARDKKVWSSVTTYYKKENGDKSFKEMVLGGEYGSIDEMRKMYVAAGGDTEYFDARVFDESKSALKKTIIYDPTDEQIEAQDHIKEYLLGAGMTEEDMSEIAYKSDTARDLKVAFRLNDEDAAVESLIPLLRAGVTRDDIYRLYDNRNKMDLNAYKKKGRYKDKLKSTGNFIWPTNGTITSHFGYRNAPTAGASSNHPAIDIGAPQGTAVVAADGGTVVYAGRNSGYGNSVGIKHDNGMVTYYNHLYSWNVKVGDTVGQGQQIAQVGSTGISTGPHLDFKILDADGNPVDPEKYLQKRS